MDNKIETKALFSECFDFIQQLICAGKGDYPLRADALELYLKLANAKAQNFFVEEVSLDLLSYEGFISELDRIIREKPGHKIYAIKFWKAYMKCGLREAKDGVERHIEKHWPNWPIYKR